MSTRKTFIERLHDEADKHPEHIVGALKELAHTLEEEWREALTIAEVFTKCFPPLLDPCADGSDVRDEAARQARDNKVPQAGTPEYEELVDQHYAQIAKETAQRLKELDTALTNKEARRAWIDYARAQKARAEKTEYENAKADLKALRRKFHDLDRQQPLGWITRLTKFSPWEYHDGPSMPTTDPRFPMDRAPVYARPTGLA